MNGRTDARASPLLPALVIAASAVLVYSNTFHAPFEFDDLQNIVLNRNLRDLAALWPPSGTRWVGLLSFALDYRIGGLSVVGYHATNLAIHVCNALLVLLLARTTLEAPALRHADAGPLVRGYLPLAAGLLFAVHPIATQAVTYVVQRFASLATLFFLLSVVLYARARLRWEAGPGSRVRAATSYVLSLVAAAAAMRTKEIAFTLPIAVAGYELLLFRPRARLLAAAPPALIALLLLPVDLLTQGHGLADALADSSRFAAETHEIPRSVYLLTQSRVVVTYLRLLVLPVGQNLDHDFRLSTSLADPAVLVSLSVLVAIAALAVLLLVAARRSNRAAGVLAFFGVAWLFLTLSVESSVIPIRDVIFEHRMYLPGAGAAIALGTALLCAVERLRSSAPLALQAGLALLLTAGPLGATAYARNRVWKDEVTLWTDVVAKSPAKARGHEALGLAYLARGSTAEAVAELQTALKLQPDSASAHKSLAAAYQAKGLDDAVREYREAIRLDPGLAEAHRGLGDAYRLKGRLEDAVGEYREAIRLDPGLAEAHANLGSAHDASGSPDEAIREYREAIRLDPVMPTPHLNLGAAYHARGRLDDAVREYREAIRLDRSKGAPHVNLGAAYQESGRLDDAIREYREAIRLDPSIAEAHENLGAAYEAKGDREEALREYREATRLASAAPGRRFQRIERPRPSPR